MDLPSNWLESGHWKMKYLEERALYYFHGLQDKAIDLAYLIDQVSSLELSREVNAAHIDSLKRKEKNAQTEIINLKARLRSLQAVDGPNLLPSIELTSSPFSGVYFIQCEISHHIKIGQSSNIKSRFGGIANNCPTPLRLIGYLGDPHNEMESYLHKRFMDANVHHEWFLPVPELLEYIKAIPYD